MRDLDFARKGAYALHVRKFFMFPEFWLDPDKQLSFVKDAAWKEIAFDKANQSSVPDKKGIYAFVVKPAYPNFIETKYLFYVGKTTRTLRIRFGEYVTERDGGGKYRTLVREMLRLYDGHLSFYCLELDDIDQITDFENRLLNSFVPYVNTDIPEATIDTNLRNVYR
jgi:hypothetical protein